jgi:hypothetical protein
MEADIRAMQPMELAPQNWPGPQAIDASMVQG